MCTTRSSAFFLDVTDEGEGANDITLPQLLLAHPAGCRDVIHAVASGQRHEVIQWTYGMITRPHPYLRGDTLAFLRPRRASMPEIPACQRCSHESQLVVNFWHHRPLSTEKPSPLAPHSSLTLHQPTRNHHHHYHHLEAAPSTPHTPRATFVSGGSNTGAEVNKGCWPEGGDYWRN
ncbi:hypothetical protein E2C01_008572 [Portunus trituberculatus]|uniref:Uncharacterized protein n=1 Tax=Portunus trituberculatus TaxID=210409 RepID=A0A5B7D2B8_PORTR|nr:hypothetical protein [Portunus trituberculatus]